MSIGGCEREDLNSPDPGAAATASGTAWFTDITDEVGLDFRHDAGVDGSFFLPEIVGAGGAFFDYDDDGRLDIYLVDSGSHGPRKTGEEGPMNRLYHQEADGRFRDVTADAGLGDTGYGMGCAIGDLDNDGDRDVFVANFGPDALYRNNGDGTFTDITASAGIRGDRWSCSSAFFDYDRDGDLDLFVTAYVKHDAKMVCRDYAGRPEYCGPQVFAGVPDVLYRNNGDGTFTDVSIASGIGQLAGRGLGVIVADLNQDAWPDVYVANDAEPNHLWINQRDGTFAERALITGIAVNMLGQPEASMGVAIGDVDGDGDQDLFITHLDRQTNTLYVNLGPTMFEDRVVASGLGEVSLPYTGFGTGFFDHDHDGDLDLVVVNGKVIRQTSGTTAPPAAAVATRESSSGELSLQEYAESNQLFDNDGTGVFRDVSSLAGDLVGEPEVSRGAVFGDVDGDGDLDVLVTNCHGRARLFRNDTPAKGHWLIVRAVDPTVNRDAIGAWVRVEAGGNEFVRLVTHTYSYLVSGAATVHFGLGTAERVDQLRVQWPDGSEEAFGAGPTDRLITLRKGQGRTSD